MQLRHPPVRFQNIHPTREEIIACHVRRRQDEAVDVRIGGVDAEAVGAERQKCRGSGSRGAGGEGVVRGVEGVGPLDEHLFEIVEDATSFSHAG